MAVWRLGEDLNISCLGRSDGDALKIGIPFFGI